MRNRIESFIAGIVGAVVMALLLSPLVRPASASYTPVPTGTIVYFNQAAPCPSGWTELTAARGRYLVGMISGATSGLTAGTAFTLTQENRTHDHSVPGLNQTGGGTTRLGLAVDRTINATIDSGGTYGFVTPGAGGGGTGGMESAKVGQVTGTATSGLNSTSATMTAPYIQLLVCSKL